MGSRVKVAVRGADPILVGGTMMQLRGRPEVELVDEGGASVAPVVLLVVDTVDESALTVARAAQRSDGARVVLVVRQLDERQLLDAVEAGVVGVIRSCEATPERLSSALVGATAGEAAVPPDLLGDLLRCVRDVQQQVLRPRGLTFSGLSEREISVLRLVADGYDTRAIATELSYSERTIKNLLQDVTRRFGLRNRSHAVAYALRQGLI